MSNIVGDISTLCLHGIFAIKKTCCFGLCLIFYILQKSQSELGMAALDCRCQHRDLWNRSMKSAAPCCACFSSSASYSSCNCKSSSFTSWRRRLGLSIMGVPWGTRKMDNPWQSLSAGKWWSSYFNYIKHHQTIENPQIFMVKPLQSLQHRTTFLPVLLPAFGILLLQ